MVVLQNKSMRNVMLFVKVNIDPEGPNIEYNKYYSSPDGEISVKYRIHLEFFVIVVEEKAQVNTPRQKNTYHNPYVQKPVRLNHFILGQFSKTIPILVFMPVADFVNIELFYVVVEFIEFGEIEYILKQRFGTQIKKLGMGDMFLDKSSFSVDVILHHELEAEGFHEKILNERQQNLSRFNLFIVGENRVKNLAFLEPQLDLLVFMINKRYKQIQLPIQLVMKHLIKLVAKLNKSTQVILCIDQSLFRQKLIPILFYFICIGMLIKSVDNFMPFANTISDYFKDRLHLFVVNVTIHPLGNAFLFEFVSKTHIFIIVLLLQYYNILQQAINILAKKRQNQQVNQFKVIEAIIIMSKKIEGEVSQNSVEVGSKSKIDSCASSQLQKGRIIRKEREQMQEEEMFQREISSSELEREERKQSQSSGRLLQTQNDRLMVDVLPIESANLLASRTRPKQRSRLIIHRITLENFKSYSGTQTIGPFHKQFSSVVGPNGSGKSNLIQSLLFIFGYSASWMRQSRLSELIHRSQGSNNKMASVEVEFRKILQHEEDSSQVQVLQVFTLKRTINISNVCKYYLNGYECSQRDVKTKLQNEGIDLNNNRFLILQGEVEQISSMPQKSDDPNKPGFLQYLQEIIGSNVYITRISQLVQKYTKLQQVRHVEGYKMKTTQNQLRGMVKQKTEATQYAKTEDLINKSQNILIQIGLLQECTALQKIVAKYNELSIEKDETVAKQKEKLQEELKRIKEITKNKKELSQVIESIKKVQEELNNLQNADKKMKEDIAFKSEDMVKFNRQIEEIDTEMGRTIKQTDQLHKGLPDLEVKMANLQKQNDELNEQLAEFDKPEIENQLRELQRIKKNKQLDIKSYENKLESIQKQYSKAFEVMKVNDQKVRILEQKITSNTGLLIKIQQALQKVVPMEGDLFSTLRHFEIQQEKLKNQLNQTEISLNDIKSECKEKGGFDNMFNKIMQENIPGVYGRLGDLGKVHDKYDQIVTSCIGNRLDNIVVENLEAATAVVEFLKKTKLGRISCIILDKIKEFSAYMKAKTFIPQGAYRVFDMIEPKLNQIAVAFYFVVRDTIYVSDSNLGLKYAMQDENQRRRVICEKKNGYIIIETNGLMNGCPAKKGGFLQKANCNRNYRNKNQLKELEGRRDELVEIIKQIGNKKQGVKKEIATVREDLTQLTKQQSILEYQIKNQRDEVNDLKRSNYTRCDWSYQQNIDHRQKQLQKQLKTIETTIKGLESEVKDLVGLIQDKEEERKIIESEKVHDKREKFKKLKQQLNELSKKINNNKAIIQHGITKVTDYKDRKINLQERLKVIQTELNKITQEQKKIELVAVQKYAYATKLENRKSECQILDREMRILLETDNKNVVISKQKIEIATANFEKCKKERASKENDVKQIKMQLERLRDNIAKNENEHPYVKDYEQVSLMCLKGEKAKQPDPKENNTNKKLAIDLIHMSNPIEDFSTEKISQLTLIQQAIIDILRSEREKLSRLPSVNLTIIKEYKQKYQNYAEKLKKFQDVVNEQQNVRQNIEKLKKQRLDLFTAGFRQINSKLREVYQLLTNGGDATLDLIDSLDPFSDGIKFSIRPPKKAWKQINKLSGGEKTLSSLSLIFALHYYRPTPVYFMDQIDAALDYRNVSVVAQYIKKRTKNAQFIIISLRNNMFQLSDKLIGIFKLEDKTKVLHYQMGEEEQNFFDPQDEQYEDDDY